MRDAARAQSAAPTAVARVHPAAAGARPCSTSTAGARPEREANRKAGERAATARRTRLRGWATAGPGQSTVDAVTSELYTQYSDPFSQSMCSTAPYFSQSMLYCPLELVSQSM